MSKLVDLINNETSDKNTIHSYIDVYEYLFYPIKESVQNLLEIGIYKGGSMVLWSKYFPNATIYGLDVSPYDKVGSSINNFELKNNLNIHLLTGVDAYDLNNFYKIFYKNYQPTKKFDIIIDDGPHTLHSMIIAIEFYSRLLTDKGILIIEDVQSIDWIETLVKATPDELKPYTLHFDLRGIKNRYDDIMFVINKNKN